MTREERVRRFVDGELDPEEIEALLRDTKADAALRRILAEEEELAAALRALKRESLVPPPPHDLVERSMQASLAARDRDERRSGARRLLEAWFRPFEVRLRLVPASLSVLLVAAAGFALLLPQRTPEREERTTPAAPLRDARAVRAIPLRLILAAEGASSVTVAGDFNDWDPAHTVLEDRDGNGVFVGTVWLPPGTYDYMFVIDGQTWVTDPYASNHRDDGFGNRNAVVRLD